MATPNISWPADAAAQALDGTTDVDTTLPFMLKGTDGASTPTHNVQRLRRLQRLPGNGTAPRRRHAIIAGYGTIGRIVATQLEEIGVPTVIVELNDSTVRKESRLGRPILFGNVSDPEVLESLDIHDADALVLTIPDEEAALRACQVARRMVPQLYIAVRTSFPEKGKRAEQLGADHVTVEEFAAAEDLCHAITSRIAVMALPSELVEREPVTQEPAPVSVAATEETAATR